ncbi:MAG: adaptor protein MecA [Oscillospiraceae bacterium]|nr:adaptor protein MecA [Oscillospiraceae bacterium]
MTIHKIDKHGIVIFITQQELNVLSISWTQFNNRIAQQWVRDALRNAGIADATPVSIEAFQNNGGILLFAILPSQSLLFRFDCFETLLEAVAAIDQPEQPNDLYALREHYILVLHGEPTPQWYEFARPQQLSIAYLNEHGKQLLHGDAVGQLAHIFSCV